MLNGADRRRVEFVEYPLLWDVRVCFAPGGVVHKHGPCPAVQTDKLSRIYFQVSEQTTTLG